MEAIRIGLEDACSWTPTMLHSNDALTGCIVFYSCNYGGFFFSLAKVYVIIFCLFLPAGITSFPKRKVGWSQAMRFSQEELNTAKNSPRTSCCLGNHSSLWECTFLVAKYRYTGKVYNPRDLILSLSLPLLSLMLRGLRSEVEPILAGLLESDFSKMLTFTAFFESIDRIVKMKVTISLALSHCSLIKLPFHVECKYFWYQSHRKCCASFPPLSHPGCWCVLCQWMQVLQILSTSQRTWSVRESIPPLAIFATILLIFSSSVFSGSSAYFRKKLEWNWMQWNSISRICPSNQSQKSPLVSFLTPLWEWVSFAVYVVCAHLLSLGFAFLS